MFSTVIVFSKIAFKNLKTFKEYYYCYTEEIDECGWVTAPVGNKPFHRGEL